MSQIVRLMAKLMVAKFQRHERRILRLRAEERMLAQENACHKRLKYIKNDQRRALILVSLRYRSQSARNWRLVELGYRRTALIAKRDKCSAWLESHGLPGVVALAA